MDTNKLKLNGKTELIIQAPHRPLPPLQSIYSGTELIESTRSAKNIGVWFDDIRELKAGCFPLTFALHERAKRSLFLTPVTPA
jgi:hypothetical protein